MNTSDHKAAAQTLFDAEQSGVQTGLLSLQYPGMTMDVPMLCRASWLNLKLKVVYLNVDIKLV